MKACTPSSSCTALAVHKAFLFVQSAPSDPRAFPQILPLPSQKLVSNPKFIKVGKTLLKAVASNLEEDDSSGTAPAFKQAPWQIKSSYAPVEVPGTAPEDESNSDDNMSTQDFERTCVQLAQYINLCSESCFDVHRDNYLAGALP